MCFVVLDRWNYKSHRIYKNISMLFLFQVTINLLLSWCLVYTARTRSYTRQCRVHGLYTAMYMVVYTCTRPVHGLCRSCTRPCTRIVMNTCRILIRPCTRPVDGRVHGCTRAVSTATYGSCSRVQNRIHGRVQAKYTGVYAGRIPIHGHVHGRVHMYTTRIGRVRFHGRVRACTRPLSKESQDKQIRGLATDVVTAPASQAYVERIFSVCGDLTVRKRNKTKQELTRKWYSEREPFYDHIVQYFKI